MLGTDKHKGAACRIPTCRQAGGEHTGPGRSIEVATNSAIRLCRFPHAVIGHLSEAAAKVPCVFQDPWRLVLPGCQVRAGPWTPALEAHSGVCGHRRRRSGISWKPGRWKRRKYRVEGTLSPPTPPAVTAEKLP